MLENKLVATKHEPTCSSTLRLITSEPAPSFEEQKKSWLIICANKLCCVGYSNLLTAVFCLGTSSLCLFSPLQ